MPYLVAYFYGLLLSVRRALRRQHEYARTRNVRFSVIAGTPGGAVNKKKMTRRRRRRFFPPVGQEGYSKNE